MDRSDDLLTTIAGLRKDVAEMQRLAASRWGIDDGGGSEIGYDQITSPVTVSSTTEATGTALITAAAHTFDGGPVICHVSAPYVQTAAVSGALVAICLFEGATEIGRIGIAITPAAVALVVPFEGRHRFTPSAGSHTYKVTGFQSSGNGVFGAGAGGTAAYLPAFIRFTRA